MIINGKVFCFFEQSGTFKNEFIKLGIPAEDYDIQNLYGNTDHLIDLFHEIDAAFEYQPSVFDDITSEDLIFAFFPCIYFSCQSQMLFSWHHPNHKNLSIHDKAAAIIKRSQLRESFFNLCVKLHSICYERNLRLIMENPWNGDTFLKHNFITKPSLIDHNRLIRGDNFVKPTAYWFINCEPTYGLSIQPKRKGKSIDSINCKHIPGTCNMLRSSITSDYARNFIYDYIFGKSIVFPSLFDNIL